MLEKQEQSVAKECHFLVWTMGSTSHGDAGGSSIGSAVSFITLVIGILMQISNELGIETTAQDARTASASFKLINIKLDIELTHADPVEAVNRLLDEAHITLAKYHRVIPEESQVLRDAATALSNLLVAKYQTKWQFQLPRKNS